MSCIITNPANGKDSALFEKFKDIFKSEQIAEIEYAKLTGNNFKNRFGDWVGNYKSTNPTPMGLVDGKTGEPLLKKDLTSNRWFFTDKNNHRDYLDNAKFSKFSAQEVEEVTNYLLYRFVTAGGKKSLNEYNPSVSELGRLSDSIDKSISSYRELIKGRENESKLSNRIDLVEEEKEAFRSELINLVSKLGLKVKDRITDAEGNSITEVSEEDRGGGVNIKESYETNSKDSATVNTKILLSQIENRELNEDETTTVPIEDGFLEVPSFAKFDDVWGTLNNILVDQVGYGYGDNVVDIFNVMVDRINEFRDIKPWMNSLLDKLEALNEDKVTEFVQAFNKTELNFFSTSYDNGEYSIINATSTNSKQSRITREWYNAFQARFLVSEKKEDKYILNLEDKEKTILKEVASRNIANHEKFKNSYYMAKKLERGNIGKNDVGFIEKVANHFGMDSQDVSVIDIKDYAFGVAAEDIVSTLEELGASDIYDDDMNTIIAMKGGTANERLIIDQLFEQTDYMLKNITSKDFQFTDGQGNNVNIFNTESHIKAFASAVGFERGDSSEKSILLNQGKTAYAISNPTYVSNKINEWKSDPEQLEKLTLDPSKKNSEWLNYLLAKNEGLDEIREEGAEFSERELERNSRIDNLVAGLDSTFKSKGKNDGVDNATITTNDQINANIVQMLNESFKHRGKSNSAESYFPTIIAADKSRRILFKGFEMFRSGIRNVNGNTYISPESIDLAFGYFLDEYNRMKIVNQENKNDDVAKVVHYHGENGNGLKSQIFPEFNRDNKDPKYQALRDAIYGESFNFYEINEMTNDQENTVKEFIKEDLLNRVDEHVSFVMGLDGLSKDLLDNYENDYIALAGDYFMNGLIASVEYTKLFSGDPAYYKNNSDLIKRIPSTYTDGLQLRIQKGKKGESLIFRQATIDGVEVSSRYVEMIKNSVKDPEIARAYEAVYDDNGKIKGGVNTTDAQAWITPRRWRFLKKGLGQWGPQHDKVYEKMRTGARMSPSEAKIAAQPLKGVYFETNQLGVERPVYLKYSQSVLIPSLVKGTPMEGLYNKMTNNPETGKPWGKDEGYMEIHEVVTIDGIKVGAVEPTKINEGDTTNMLAEADIVLNPQVLNNRGWKLQQDLPIKLMHDTNVGSQIQKNILEGLQHDQYYKIDGKKVLGKTLNKRINDTVSKLSDIGKAQLEEKFGIDSSGRIKNTDYLYQALIQEFKDRGGNENVVAALEKRLAFDAIPQVRGRVESIFMSIFNKALTKISTQGGSFIQVSPFGLETVGKDSNITITSKNYNNEGLLPPRIVKGKVLPGQAMIPHSYAVKILSKHLPDLDLSKISLDDAVKLLDPSALELITYRIPNQGMSSNDYLEIVGILPQGVGDSIIVYDGLPAKTGSDFDIDKLFVMQNHLVFNAETKRLEKLTEDNKKFAVKSKASKKAFEERQAELEYDYLLGVYGDNAVAYFTGVIPLSKEDKAAINDLRENTSKDVMYSEAEIEKMITENNLVAQYKSILNSPLTYDQMMRSIDGAQLKDDIAGNPKKGIKGLFPSKEMKNMELFSPLTQLKVKSEYLSGKMGVGQTANQLVDHVMNQNLDIQLGSYLGIGNSKEVLTESGKTKTVTFFDSETQGEHSIADNLSAFLNAYVDIAKDPYISRGNHNSITANTTFMLLRAGVPLKWVNRFIGQPILKELVELQKESQSITSSDIVLDESSGSPLDKIMNDYGFDKKRFTAKENAEFLSGLTESKLESRINGETDIDLDNNILLSWIYLQEKGKEFGKAVVAAKSDTAGAGGSNIDRLVNYNKIEKVKSDGIIKNYESKFIGTMLGTYRRNTLDWTRDAIRASNLFLSGTAGAEKSFNSISFQTGNGDLLVDQELGKAIDNGYYSYVMSGTRLFKNNYKNYDYITKNIPEKVFNRKEGGTENDFLNALEIETRAGKMYLGINNKDKATYYQNKIYRGWMDLYNKFLLDENGRIDRLNIHPDRQLAIDLARYAYTSSGFQNNLAQFFTHIPHEILKDADLSNEVREVMSNNNDFITDHNFVDQLQRHNKDNNKIVKRVKSVNVEGNGVVFAYKPSVNKSQDISKKDARGNDFFPKFVSSRVKVSQDGRRETFLYERIGDVKRMDGDGAEIYVPVYARTYELGSTDGKYKTFEYNKDESITKSNIPSNNLSKKYKESITKFTNEFKKDPTFRALESRELNQSIADNLDKQEISNVELIKSNLAQILEDKKIPCK